MEATRHDLGFRAKCGQWRMGKWAIRTLIGLI